MKAVGYRKNLPVDDPEALVDVALPDPVPGPHDLLVRVEAVSVNPVDTKVRRNAPAPEDAPRVLGFDASGVVERVGADVTLFRPGDAVFYAGTLDRPGSNAELQLVDERIVGHKPGSLGHAAAAALSLVALTAAEMLFDRLAIQRYAARPQTLLVLGGAGGVPSLAIQLARNAGASVIATASRPESAQWVRDMGAHHVIDHTQPLDAQIRAIGDGTVDCVFSTHTTARAWAELAGVIAPQGRFGLIDSPPALDLNLYKPRSVSVHWEYMFTRPLQATPDLIRQHEILEFIAQQVDRGALRAIDTRNLGTVNAAHLREAHALVEAGHTIGKIVLAGF